LHQFNRTRIKLIGQDSHATLAIITSYISLISQMVILMRSSFSLIGVEMLLSLLVNIIYSIRLSIQLFKIGALKTGRTIGFEELFKRMRNSKSTAEKI